MILLAELTPSTLLFIGALAVVSWMLLMRSHRYFARQKQQEPFPTARSEPTVEPRGHHLDAPAAMARWEVQMHDTAREASAQLDSKMSALEALIADADRAAARLEAALARSAEAAPGSQRPQPQPTSQAESLKPPHPAAPPAGKIPPDGAAELSGGAVQRGSADRREEIYTLADYGFEPAEIARRVGSPIGEVQLILGLREKK